MALSRALSFPRTQRQWNCEETSSRLALFTTLGADSEGRKDRTADTETLRLANFAPAQQERSYDRPLSPVTRWTRATKAAA